MYPFSHSYVFVFYLLIANYPLHAACASTGGSTSVQSHDARAGYLGSRGRLTSATGLLDEWLIEAAVEQAAAVKTNLDRLENTEQSYSDLKLNDTNNNYE